ncbi:hypothetical protein DR63_3935 [Burkholderia thailandensis E264]|uniref:Uncharacterized protein n=1 Tax=Burkholderia thailandensis (strain ATCC 700388 / DSM 13276 / CCUG 48851 / CIP 106301 / E264) TaxID=271848 RepID=Q2T461_BURTA|nr:hypothetical protein BTH_II1844 [Burkholderia thailandensis E264]AHI77212.1 hypothetical protein BTQ_5128 [Burkholderia thailandensis 2002721723]AIP29227.1 hypothetical protein DR63_3935 [Burkholderia thailandensis E264]AJY01723.1 hypothetical protein BG87_4585 [Burkholderia thailandensis 2002721643]
MQHTGCAARLNPAAAQPEIRTANQPFRLAVAPHSGP